MSYFAHLGTAISQAINALAGGHPDESLSARAHYDQHTSRLWPAVRVISDTLYFWEPLHCARAARADLSRAGWVLRRARAHQEGLVTTRHFQ
jgi:hypothetical protein